MSERVQALDRSFINLAHAEVISDKGGERVLRLPDGRVVRVLRWTDPMDAGAMWSFVQWETGSATRTEREGGEG